MELIEQRDGLPYGRVLFHQDVAKQRFREFTEEEQKLYYDKFADFVDKLNSDEDAPEKMPQIKRRNDI